MVWWVMVDGLQWRQKGPVSVWRWRRAAAAPPGERVAHRRWPYACGTRALALHKHRPSRPSGSTEAATLIKPLTPAQPQLRLELAHLRSGSNWRVGHTCAQDEQAWPRAVCTLLLPAGGHLKTIVEAMLVLGDGSWELNTSQAATSCSVGLSRHAGSSS